MGIDISAILKRPSAQFFTNDTPERVFQTILLDSLFQGFVEESLVTAPAGALLEMLDDFPIQVNIHPLLQGQHSPFFSLPKNQPPIIDVGLRDQLIIQGLGNRSSTFADSLARLTAPALTLVKQAAFDLQLAPEHPSFQLHCLNCAADKHF